MIATGNIYISPNVTELDGVYTTQPLSVAAGGKIYTCSPPLASLTATDNIPASFIANAYTGCSNQLTVYGSFVANQVVMMRTFGSLRDEAPIVVNTPVTNYDFPVQLAQYSCAVGNTGNTYQHSHWYEAAGSSTVPPASTCPNPSLDGYQGYVFSPDDTTFTASYLNSSYWALCEFVQPISGNDDHYVGASPWTPGFSCANAFAMFADKDPVLIGYVPGGAISGKTQPVYQYYDAGSYGNTGYHYYTIQDSGAGVDNVTEEFDGALFNDYINPAAGAIAVSTTTVTTNPLPTPPLTCSNAPSGLKYPTCAAEVFRFSPELYLSSPSGLAPTWDAVTGLPPVL